LQQVGKLRGLGQGKWDLASACSILADANIGTHHQEPSLLPAPGEWG